MSDPESKFDAPPAVIPPAGELVTLPRPYLEELLGHAATLEARTIELSAEAMELRRKLGELMVSGYVSDPVDDQSQSEREDTELPSEATPSGLDSDVCVPKPIELFSSAELLSRVPQEVLSQRSENERALRDRVQSMVEPYRNLLVGEMLSRVHANSSHSVSPAPQYTADPDAWHKYVNKKGKTVTWDDTYEGATYTFAVTYLPLAEGNRLVRFAGDIVKLLPDERGGKDRLTTTTKLTFDRGELVEAGLEEHKSAGDYPRPFRIKSKSSISMGFGKRMHISELWSYSKKPKSFVYDQETDGGAFVDIEAAERHVKGYPPISRDEYLERLQKVLEALPKMSSR